MKDYYGLEVFYFGKYYSDVSTDSQFNRVGKTDKAFSSKDLKMVLKRNGVRVNNEEVLKIKKKLLTDHCFSKIVTLENGFCKQYVIILKTLE